MITECPKCGSEVIRDEVDIGVGTIYGPARCDNCEWGEEEVILGGNTDELRRP